MYVRKFNICTMVKIWFKPVVTYELTDYVHSPVL